MSDTLASDPAADVPGGNSSAIPPKWPLILLTALSLSIGWGIRGNYGHEFGAMIPGALAPMAAVLLSGRADWQRRIAYFAAFGAVGWCFGGSISYMQVIAYTHSGHSGSVLYGFACLFVIGFLWAAAGGAGAALPAFLSKERLTEFFPPLIVIYAAWIGLEYAYEPLNSWLAGVLGSTFIAHNSDYRQTEPLYWFDTDWTSVLVAIVAVLTFCSFRRKIDKASSLILHMAVGWWAGFLILTVILGLRMTPPRGDSWAGSVGLTLGMYLFLQKDGLSGVTFASLVTAFIGGLGFAGATLFKLIELRTGWETNWHSVLEQTYGLINGVGVAVAMLLLVKRAPQVTDEPAVRRWTDWFAPGFVLLFITYVNLRKNLDDWVKAKSVPAAMYGLPAEVWFNVAYMAIGAVIVWALVRHSRRPLDVVPSTWLGKGEILYLALLWWMVMGNFAKAVVAFAPQRLITEWVITLNAALCSLLLLAYGWTRRSAASGDSTDYSALNRRTMGFGLAAALTVTFLSWGIVRAIYGDRFAGYAGKHIRFGPNATATTARPSAGQPHP